MKVDKVLSFTGRRPKDLYKYDKEKYIPIVNKLVEILESFYLQGFKTFVSGGAQGFDQLAFWAVNRLKTKYPDIKNVCYIPFPGQESMWLKKGLFSQEEFHLMLSLADEVVYCSDTKPTDKMGINIAMHKRNHCMVDVSDIVLGLYPNDDWANVNVYGGTAECLKYALDKNKPIYILNPFNLDFYLFKNEN